MFWKLIHPKLQEGNIISKYIVVCTTEKSSVKKYIYTGTVVLLKQVEHYLCELKIVTAAVLNKSLVQNNSSTNVISFMQISYKWFLKIFKMNSGTSVRKTFIKL